VTDANTSSTTGLFANFSLSDLAAGDVIHVEVSPVLTDGVGTAYVGAVGFAAEPAPEPSTWLMVLSGLGFAALVARHRRVA
jgi:hypothetical protein